MDRKNIEQPELRSSHILNLHRELCDAKIQIKTLEAALARAAAAGNGKYILFIV